jgi:hypothetical protein
MAGGTLRRCDRCRRHVRADDPRCPFCASDARARGFATAVTLGATLGACGARDLPQAETDATTTSSMSSTSSTVDTIDSADPTTAATTMPGTTMSSETMPMDTGTSVDDSSSSDGDDGGCQAGFYGGCPPDSGPDDFECDVWAQDCQRGEKCMPWANDGGPLWNATRCTPLDPDPADVGEPCNAEGSGVSGIDDCALGAMCWGVDDMNAGTCVDMCMGSEANPTCANPETSCAIGYNGAVIVCLPICDPLLQDCVDGDGCYLTNDEFLCQPVFGVPAGHGEPCTFVDSCEVGLQCTDGVNVVGCAGLSCCTEFCDLEAADPNAPCSAAADGEVCTVLLDGGEFPNVGICRLPD